MKDILLKTLALSDKEAKVQAIGVIALILIGVFLEALGIGLIFPFIQVIIAPEKAAEMPWIGEYLTVTKDGISPDTILGLTIALLSLFVVKNLVLLVVYFVQAHFSASNLKRLSRRLYGAYLNGPYSLFLTRNSADLIQNTYSAAAGVFASSFMGFLTLFSETILMVGIMAVLIFVNPLITLAAGVVVGGSAAVSYLVLSRRIQVWGERTLRSQKDIFKTLQQGFHAIKEIKVLGREPYLIRDYETPLGEYADLVKIKHVMIHAPRLWVDTLAMAGVLLVVFLVMRTSGDTGSLLAVLSVYAAASFRLIPSVNRILVALNRINDAKYSVDVVYDDITKLEDAKPPDGGNAVPFAFEKELRIEDLSFRYETANTAALNGIDLTLERGGSLGLVGPSGAGKSTLVDIILGLLEPTSGRVNVDGIDIASAPRSWQQRCGYVPQTIYLIDDTLRRNVALGLEDNEIDEGQIENAIHLSRLEDMVRDLPHGLNTNVGEQGIRLSGGQRQRVGIARALYRDPEVLVFDEATSSLDSETEHEINTAIEPLSGEKTLIIIAHRLSTVRQCSQLAFLDNGRISDMGSFDELIGRNDTFRNLVELSRL